MIKGSTTKSIKAADPLPNNNTFILLADNHGPRKTNTTNNDTATCTITTNTTPPIN